MNLTKDEERYLSKIPEDKIAILKPFNSKAQTIAREIISKIKSKNPDLVVKHMGASGLGISGQGDLDIYALAKPKEITNYLPSFVELFGEPKSKKEDSIAWEFKVEDYSVELYLTNPESEPMKRQIAVFEALNSDPLLRSEYEITKAEMNGKPFRDYQRKKYEFYHRILGEEPKQ